MIDILATQEHFVDHLAPLWSEMRWHGIAGKFWTTDALRDRAARAEVPHCDIETVESRGPQECSHLLVASIGDAKKGMRLAMPGRMALLEHGCGLSFTGDGRNVSNHSGGHGVRDFVSLFLMTNEWCARRDREAHPEARVEVIGAPKLDWMCGKSWPTPFEPTIAWATHWDCRTAPETRSALSWFWPGLKKLSRRNKVIGHAHPRASNQPWDVYQDLGIEAVRDFSEVLERADLLVGDCGSAPYEFARTGKPVVLLNAPCYRKHVHHGLRFWEMVPGLQCDRHEDLLGIVDAALCDGPDARRLRDAANESVYPHFGCATGVAVRALQEWQNES